MVMSCCLTCSDYRPPSDGRNDQAAADVEKSRSLAAESQSISCRAKCLPWAPRFRNRGSSGQGRSRGPIKIRSERTRVSRRGAFDGGSIIFETVKGKCVWKPASSSFSPTSPSLYSRPYSSHGEIPFHGCKSAGNIARFFMSNVQTVENVAFAEVYAVKPAFAGRSERFSCASEEHRENRSLGAPRAKASY
jgi:hypothetical protein